MDVLPSFRFETRHLGGGEKETNRRLSCTSPELVEIAANYDGRAGNNNIRLINVTVSIVRFGTESDPPSVRRICPCTCRLVRALIPLLRY